MSQAPKLHLVMQLLNVVRCNLTELTTKRAFLPVVFSGVLVCMQQDSMYSLTVTCSQLFTASVYSELRFAGITSSNIFPPFPPFFHCIIQSDGRLSPLPRGCSWLGFRDLPAMGAVSIWELAANGGRSRMSLAPNHHLAMQYIQFQKELIFCGLWLCNDVINY